jgi:hypothetical protein
LIRRGVAIRERTVTNFLDRYDELPALSCSDPERWNKIAAVAG